VRFVREGAGEGVWRIEPVGGAAIAPMRRGFVTAFPTLRAAARASVAGDPPTQVPEAEPVRLPGGGAWGEDVFAIRAEGSSMDGGKEPIRDGDWVVMRWARAAGLGAVEGRVALVEVTGAGPDAAETGEAGYRSKRVIRGARGHVLRSDRPDAEDLQASEACRPLAVKVAVVKPEEMAPAPGTAIARDGFGAAFGVEGEPRAPWSRLDGHLFVVVGEAGADLAGAGIAVPELAAHSGETAHVLRGKTVGGAITAWRCATRRKAVPPPLGFGLDTGERFGSIRWDQPSTLRLMGVAGLANSQVADVGGRTRVPKGLLRVR